MKITRKIARVCGHAASATATAAVSAISPVLPAALFLCRWCHGCSTPNTSGSGGKIFRPALQNGGKASLLCAPEIICWLMMHHIATQRQYGRKLFKVVRRQLLAADI